MARSQFSDTAIDQYGNAVTSTLVTVYNYGTPTLSTVYANESGSTLKGNPFNASTGYIDFWVEPGSYDVVISDEGSPAAYTTRTVRFDAIPAVDGVIPQTIADEAVEWAHFATDRESLAYGALCQTTVRSVANAGRYPPVGSATPLSFTVNKNTTGTPDAFNASTGIYTAAFDAVYLGFVTMTYSIAVTTSGAARPILSYGDGLGGSYNFGYMQSNIGFNSFTGVMMVRLLVGQTTRLSVTTGVTIDVEAGGNAYSTFTLFPLYPI